MNAIEVRGLRKEFDGFSLGPVNLTLPSGCIMGLIGENGAGKTTLIKLLMGAMKPSGGSVCVLGERDLRRRPAVKEEIGGVLAEPCFPEEITAAEMGIVLAHSYARWDAEAYKAYLERFELPRDKKFKDFSRGMKMKLAIAAALSHRSKLLVLDEPTSGLDPVVRDTMLDLFFEFTREEDHSILISSHIVSDLEKLCDYVAFLHKGTLRLSEEKDRLLERYGLYRCTQAELDALPPGALKGKRVGSYGVEALVDRDKMPGGAALQSPGLEDVIVYMAKGGRP